jgi:hypothetical protein
MVRKNRLKKSRKHKVSFMRRTFKKMFKGGIYEEGSSAPTREEIKRTQEEYMRSSPVRAQLRLEELKHYTLPPQLISSKKKTKTIPHSNILGYSKLPQQGVVKEQDSKYEDWELIASKPGQMRHINPLPPGYTVEKEAERSRRYNKYMEKKHKLDKKLKQQTAFILADLGTKQLDEQIDEQESEMEKRSLDYTKFVPQAAINLPLDQHHSKHKNVTLTTKRNSNPQPQPKELNQLKKTFQKISKSLKNIKMPKINRTKINRTPSPTESFSSMEA